MRSHDLLEQFLGIWFCLCTGVVNFNKVRHPKSHTAKVKSENICWSSVALVCFISSFLCTYGCLFCNKHIFVLKITATHKHHWSKGYVLLTPFHGMKFNIPFHRNVKFGWVYISFAKSFSGCGLKFCDQGGPLAKDNNTLKKTKNKTSIF